MPRVARRYIDPGPFDVLERVLRDPEASALSLEILEAAQPGSLGELATRRTDSSESNAAQIDEGDLTHFRDHWLGSWWPGHPVEGLLRNGFIEALRIARRNDLPVETLWVQAGGDAFHVYIAESPQQITMLVYTPLPDDQTEATPPRGKSVHVVRTREADDGDRVRMLEKMDGGEIVLA